MKPECRAELRKIRGAATQGSWVGGPMGVLSGATWVVENTLDDSGDIMGSEDTECIVAAVNALVPLLDALDAAEADKVLAAGELLVEIPEPGTESARLLLANTAMRRERDALAKRVAELEGLLTNAHLRNATDQDEHSAQRAALSKRVAELEGATDRELCLGCGHPVSDCVESWSAPDAGGCSGRFAGRGVIIRLRAALRKALKGGT